MAVIPTGAIYKSLFFDGESSRNYGVYITGEAVYNAPVRDVEMIKIPGRNGEFALDNGRFENIEVTYPAGIFADNEADFAEAISDFRNFLASRTGYCRLEDDYNPTEYRMAVYKSGLDVDAKVLKAGEFDITFDCKPQRWLKDGETADAIGEWGETETVSGDIVSVDNPNGILAVKSLEVDLESIQSGSGTPSPTNVRPISGHTDVVVSRSGKNLCDTSLVYNGYINVSQQKVASNANARILYLPCKPNTAYTVSKQAGQRFAVAESTVIPTNNVVVSNIVSDYTASSITITTTASAKYLVAFVYLSTADTGVTADAMIASVQVELGSTATAYEPYQGDTYTTALGRTVYGGTLDVVSGELVVDRVAVDMGSLNWYANGAITGGVQYAVTISDKKVGETNFICSAYETHTPSADLGYICGRASTSVVACNATQTNVNDFKTAVTGQTICYELAEPQTYQLTAQQISLLTGDNNIWSDGAVTLEYGQNPSVLFNPTLFESSPLLETAGSGSIQFNGYEIEFEGVPYGEVQIAEKTSWTMEGSAEFTFDTTLLNTGDPIHPEEREFEIKTWLKATSGKFIDEGIISSTNVLDAYGRALNKTVKQFNTYMVPDLGDGFVYGTAKTITCSAVFHYQYGIGQTSYWRETVEATIAYGGADSYTVTVQSSGNKSSNVTRNDTEGITTPTMYGDSSKPNNDPIFIDCDLGEAYTNEDGVYRSLNQYIDLGSDLPTLGVGANEVTFDNTITELKITPRFWKV